MGEYKMCPRFEATFSLISKRWVGLIWEVLLDGPLRFSQIQSRIPQVSDRMLVERLKEMEAFGIVNRRVVTSMPVQVLYSLTEKGQAFSPVLDSVHRWADEWVAEEQVL